VYFAILSVVIILSYSALLPLRIVARVVGIWLSITFVIYSFLIHAFPVYLDSVYIIHLITQERVYWLIVRQIGWFMFFFGFMFIFVLPKIAQLSECGDDERRRQKYFFVGAAIVCIYVVAVMLPHRGNSGTYLLHLIAPIILAYALGRRERSSPEFERWVGVAAILTMCMMVFVTPWNLSGSLLRWKVYGVVWRDDLDRNRNTIDEVERVLQESNGGAIYLDFSLAPIAIKKDIEYLDTGNREYIVEYMNLKIAGSLKLPPLVEMLSWHANGPKRLHPEVYMEQAEVVICAYRCPGEETHHFVRNLGLLHTALNGSEMVQLYRRVH
jgi:hypothetical protein